MKFIIKNHLLIVYLSEKRQRSLLLRFYIFQISYHIAD